MEETPRELAKRFSRLSRRRRKATSEFLTAQRRLEAIKVKHDQLKDKLLCEHAYAIIRLNSKKVIRVDNDNSEVFEEDLL